MDKTIQIIGYACELGTTLAGGSEGPLVLQQSPYQKELSDNLHWHKIISSHSPKRQLDALDEIRYCCQDLANITSELTHQQQPFVVVGGDHSSAIGTWSGVATASKKPLGLIWVDAHLDSHTPETSKTKSIHGMPAATLLGYGDSKLTTILSDQAKIKPENIVFIGIRSFQSAEQELLEKLGVKIFYMDDVKQQGLQPILQQTLAYLNKKDLTIGMTLDLDAIDPQDAPAVAVAEHDGIRATELLESLAFLCNHANIKALEIAEFTPCHDVDHKTETLIFEIIRIVMTLGPVSSTG
ncbi:MAG: arginase [Gammaproteobacteria bacterium]|nr:arginase [Gammaproteobacteria bacterium]MCH9744075.1 arginase [Gammaproteobacteria bacterium]